jgi:thymidylate kinase
LTERSELNPGVEREPETGTFIVLYGVNNLGKSTQLTLLETALAARGETIMRRKSPNYELLSGRIINAILREGRVAENQELQQWQAINMHQEQQVITAALEAGTTVVSEDYWGTTLAWGLGQGLTREDLDAMVDGLRPPDVSILLHGERFIDSTEAGHRHETNSELTDRVQRIHLELADELGWHMVNANQTKAEIHAQIMSLIKQEVAA